ncbi:MAG: hypothetical protein RLZZ299_2305 [Pseudomonadota bacterium]|jgi:hypothetical protein
MIRALGTCLDRFDPDAPGRLCRRRERWLEAMPSPGAPILGRLVISGATFTDAGAEDARRGLSCAGVDAGDVLAALFPDSALVAFAMAGDPRTVPESAAWQEDWSLPLAAGRRRVPAVRWLAPCAPADVSAWIAGERDGVACPRADGFLVGCHDDVSRPSSDLLDALHALAGFALAEEPPAQRYLAPAIPSVLRHADALVLLHEDKHAPLLAAYATQELPGPSVLAPVARAAGALYVPFDIPPMLARWDRAIWDLQQHWDSRRDGEFPVPPVVRGRRGRRAGDAAGAAAGDVGAVEE